jgi:subtilase family serine protease
MKLKVFFAFSIVAIFFFCADGLKATEIRVPDLFVYAIGLSPQDPCVNEAVTFSVQVNNSGTALAPASKLRMTIGGGPVLILPVPPIDPGNYQHVRVTRSFSTVQKYLVTATADCENSVSESNEGNNAKSRNFEVYSSCCPDLLPDRMWVWPSKPTVQHVFSLRVWVRNTGRRPSSATQLEVFVGGASKPLTFSVPSIAAGNNERMFQKDLIMDTPGKYRARFVVDPQNVVAECDEQNNIGFLDFKVEK